MGWTSTNDHYNGFYIFEDDFEKYNQSSLPNTYRRYRTNVLNLIDDLDFRAKINFINKKIHDTEELIKSDVKIYADYVSHGIFSSDEYEGEFRRNENLLRASFLLFLQILKSDYEFIYTDNFNNIKWLKDIAAFEKLYNILNKYNVINIEYFDFCAFWQLKSQSTLHFKSTISNTSILFHQLVKFASISELTLDDLFTKESIFVNHGRNKSIKILNRTTYKREINKFHNDNGTIGFDKNFKPILVEIGII